MLLADAIQLYHEGAGKLVGETTRIEYRAATDALLAWAKSRSITTVRNLNSGELARFPAYCATLKNKKRAGLISPHTVNKLLSGCRIVLNQLRREQVVRLTSDGIKDSLRKVKADMELRPFLRPHQIRQLLDACRRHDSLVFKIPRNKAKNKPRYPAILPLVEFLLLSGCRVDTAISLLGSDVLLDQLEIHCRAETVKHGLAYMVDLSVSKMLTERAATWSKHDERLFPLTVDQVTAAFRRLVDEHEAPDCSPHTLRRSCGTYLANMACFGVFKAAKHNYSFMGAPECQRQRKLPEIGRTKPCCAISRPLIFSTFRDSPPTRGTNERGSEGGLCPNQSLPLTNAI